MTIYQLMDLVMYTVSCISIGVFIGERTKK